MDENKNWAEEASSLQTDHRAGGSLEGPLEEDHVEGAQEPADERQAQDEECMPQWQETPFSQESGDPEKTQNRTQETQNPPQIEDPYQLYRAVCANLSSGAPKKRKKGLVWAFVGTAVGSMLLGMLLATCILLTADSHESLATPTITEEPEQEEEIPRNTVEEYPSELPQFGGQSVDIEDSYNPVPEIYEQTHDSVVSITSYYVTVEDGERVEMPVTRGSAFFITENGYLVTNNHVLQSSNYFTVTTQDGEELEAIFVGNDATRDIAVLKVEGEVRAVAIGDSDDLLPGEIAVVIGNPYGASTMLMNSVTVGYISSVNRELMFNNEIQSFIQTDAAMNPGNSGGPMFNSKGQVIGVVTLKSLISSITSDGSAVGSEGIGFAMPINAVMESVEQIILNGSIEKPGIGVYFYALTEEEAREYGLEYGAMISSFIEGGTAEEAGLKVFDIIVECQGIPFNEIEDLPELIKQIGIEGTVHFKVFREGEYLDIEVPIVDMNKALW